MRAGIRTNKNKETMNWFRLEFREWFVTPKRMNVRSSFSDWSNRDKIKNKINFKINSINFYAGLHDEVAYDSRGVSYMTAHFLLVPSFYKQFLFEWPFWKENLSENFI